jgi:hypothetical protein
VIGYSDARDVKKTAADRAVRDLQNRVPDMSLEYKPLRSLLQPQLSQPRIRIRIKRELRLVQVAAALVRAVLFVHNRFDDGQQ